MAISTPSSSLMPAPAHGSTPLAVLRIANARFYLVYVKFDCSMEWDVYKRQVLSFMSSWSNFMGALLYLNKPSMYPVSYALKLFSDETGTNYGPMFAMSVASLMPILILFFIFQKSLVEGLSLIHILYRSKILSSFNKYIEVMFRNLPFILISYKSVSYTHLKLFHAAGCYL